MMKMKICERDFFAPYVNAFVENMGYQLLESTKSPVIIGKIRCQRGCCQQNLDRDFADFYKRAIRPKQTVYRK